MSLAEIQVKLLMQPNIKKRPKHTIIKLTYFCRCKKYPWNELGNHCDGIQFSGNDLLCVLKVVWCDLWQLTHRSVDADEKNFLIWNPSMTESQKLKTLKVWNINHQVVMSETGETQWQLICSWFTILTSDVSIQKFQVKKHRSSNVKAS